MRFFNIYNQLQYGHNEIESHIESLLKMANEQEHKELFAHLYGCLSILDAKSASLLQFNSIIIAVFVIFLTGTIDVLQFLVIAIGMLSVLVASIILLSVIWVHWSTTVDLSNLSEHANRLLLVRRTRTIRYRISWYLANISIIMLLSFLVTKIFMILK